MGGERSPSPLARDVKPPLGVIVTAANTVLEADLWRSAGHLATWHVTRVADNKYAGAGAASHRDSLLGILEGLGPAIELLREVDPVTVVLGFSAAPFREGPAAHARWKSELEQAARVPVVTLADAVERALANLSGARVALLTPLPQAANAPIIRYLEELGVIVVRSIGLDCPSTAAIAAVSADELRPIVNDLARGVDAVVQVGTNLNFLNLAAVATDELGLPVIAANQALTAAALERARVPEA